MIQRRRYGFNRLDPKSALALLAVIIVLVVPTYLLINTPPDGELEVFVSGRGWETVQVYANDEGKDICIDWNRGAELPAVMPNGDLCAPETTRWRVSATHVRYFVSVLFLHSTTTMVFPLSPEAWEELEIGYTQLLSFDGAGLVVGARFPPE